MGRCGEGGAAGLAGVPVIPAVHPAGLSGHHGKIPQLSYWDPSVGHCPELGALQNSRSIWWDFLGILCRARTGFEDPCGSIPTQDIPRFHDPHREKGEGNVISAKSQFPKIVREDLEGVMEGHVQSYLQTLLFV